MQHLKKRFIFKNRILRETKKKLEKSEKKLGKALSILSDLNYEFESCLCGDCVHFNRRCLKICPRCEELLAKDCWNDSEHVCFDEKNVGKWENFPFRE